MFGVYFFIVSGAIMHRVGLSEKVCFLERVK